MSRVFALEPTTKDISSANEFGEIVYLFDADNQPSVWNSAKYLLAVQARLEELQFSEDDFFLAAGPTVQLLLVMGYLSNTYPEFHVLFWQAQIKEYVPRGFNHKDYTNATAS